MATRPILHTKSADAPAAPAPAPEAAAPEKHDLVALAPTPELNPRARMMAEIAERSNSDANEAAKETLPVGDGESEAVAVAAPSEPPAAEPVQAADPDATVPQAEPAAAATQATPTGIDPNAEYEFTIEGVKQKIKGSQVIARTQKGEAADYRLELASRLLEEAKQRAVQQAQPPAQGVAPQAAAAPELSDADLAHIIQFGTKEQAAEAIKALRAQKPDAVTKQELAAFMAQVPRVVDAQRSFHDGLSVVQKEYGDLLNDPYLRQLFFFKENELRKAGDKRAHAELYKSIGDDLRKHFNRQPAAAASAPTAQAAAPTIAQKQAAKAAAPAAPRLASVRLGGVESENKPKSREEVIDQMRKARGQASLTTR